MARIDSLILVMLGIAQILIGSSTTLEFFGIVIARFRRGDNRYGNLFPDFYW